MTKKQRQEVYDKYGGKCAYCGCELGKRWHADHLQCLHRESGYDREKRKWFFTGNVQFPENDTVENMMPSCASCNITKATLSLEDFRDYIQRTVESLNKNRYAAYKFAKRYGLIQETIKPVVFYFETITNNKC